MASLGRLAAGLAHELNNPTSAVVRGAEALTRRLPEVEAAFRVLGQVGLSADAAAAFDRLSSRCLSEEITSARSAVERAHREDALAGWLARHGLDPMLGECFEDSAILPTDLDELATRLDGTALEAAVRALAAGCSARGLADEVERAASRVHDLVAAVKGFTYMDHGTAPTPVNIARGLADTLAVLKTPRRTGDTCK